MDFALAAVAFAPGLALGSFLNVVAARVPLKRSIVRPPSACMECGKEIALHDNVPLLSYAVLRGRCRHCGVRIPLVYPLVTSRVFTRDDFAALHPAGTLGRRSWGDRVNHRPDEVARAGRREIVICEPQRPAADVAKFEHLVD